MQARSKVKGFLFFIGLGVLSFVPGSFCAHSSRLLLEEMLASTPLVAKRFMHFVRTAEYVSTEETVGFSPFRPSYSSDKRNLLTMAEREERIESAKVEHIPTLEMIDSSDVSRISFPIMHSLFSLTERERRIEAAKISFTPTLISEMKASGSTSRMFFSIRRSLFTLAEREGRVETAKAICVPTMCELDADSTVSRIDSSEVKLFSVQEREERIRKAKINCVPTLEKMSHVGEKIRYDLAYTAKEAVQLSQWVQMQNNDLDKLRNIASTPPYADQLRNIYVWWVGGVGSLKNMSTISEGLAESIRAIDCLIKEAHDIAGIKYNSPINSSSF